MAEKGVILVLAVGVGSSQFEAVNLKKHYVLAHSLRMIHNGLMV